MMMRMMIPSFQIFFFQIWCLSLMYLHNMKFNCFQKQANKLFKTQASNSMQTSPDDRTCIVGSSGEVCIDLLACFQKLV